MSQITFQATPTGTGNVTVAAPTTNTNRTINLPDANGTLFLNSVNGALNVNAAAPANAVNVDASGNLLAGTTSNGQGSRFAVAAAWPQTPASLYCNRTAGQTALDFVNNGTQVGRIDTTSTTTSYITSSDYRLKTEVQPMTGALARVEQLRPVTYKWRADGSDGEGFIAHELQAVCPSAVTGEKDAVDADGKPVYQGIDTSFLVATLTAAIQELKAEVDSLKARLASDGPSNEGTQV